MGWATLIFASFWTLFITIMMIVYVYMIWFHHDRPITTLSRIGWQLVTFVIWLIIFVALTEMAMSGYCTAYGHTVPRQITVQDAKCHLWTPGL